ncbi:MAG: YdcF family protein [Acidimicrobiales bacterium]|nr:YdcF family protein [Acidimicrobiales bacterium]
MRPLRLAVRLALLVGVVAVGYLAVTGFQVWRAGREDHAGPADAIVVLGAAQYDGRPSPVYKARLDHAADLYERDLAPLVLVTGGRRPGDRFTEAAAGAGYLAGRGVPEDAILLESGGTDSWSSLSAAARVLGDRRRVLLVSSPYHALRIRHIAAELGLDARSSPSPSREGYGARAWHLASETVRVGAGRILGYGRLVRLGDGVG